MYRDRLQTGVGPSLKRCGYVQGYVQLGKLETKMGYCQDAVNHLESALQ